MKGSLPALLIGAVAAPSGAAVLDSGANGFTVSVERALGSDAAEPRRTLWALLIAPERWWSPAHTWTGDASNMALDAAVGGCWCEKLADGGRVEHARVIAIEPQRRLRMLGSLGPLQSLAATGLLDWSIGAKAGQDDPHAALRRRRLWAG